MLSPPDAVCGQLSTVTELKGKLSFWSFVLDSSLLQVTRIPGQRELGRIHLPVLIWNRKEKSLRNKQLRVLMPSRKRYFFSDEKKMNQVAIISEMPYCKVNRLGPGVLKTTQIYKYQLMS